MRTRTLSNEAVSTKIRLCALRRADRYVGEKWAINWLKGESF